MYFDDINIGETFSSEEIRVTEEDLMKFLRQDIAGGYKNIYIKYSQNPKMRLLHDAEPGEMTSTIMTSLLLGIIDCSKAVVHLETSTEFLLPLSHGNFIWIEVEVKEKEKTNARRGQVIFSLKLIALVGEKEKELAKGTRTFLIPTAKAQKGENDVV